MPRLIPPFPGPLSGMGRQADRVNAVRVSAVLWAVYEHFVKDPKVPCKLPVTRPEHHRARARHSEASEVAWKEGVVSMKERSILFSGSMVRAILEGRKTQTRRLVTPQPVRTVESVERIGTREDGMPIEVRFPPGWRHPKYGFKADEVAGSFADNILGQSEYYKGQRLWVRETWKSLGYGRAFGCELHYAADGYDPATDYAARERHRRVFEEAPDRDDRFRPLNFGPWRPSIFMPRWASRLLLEVTEVRVQRLQEISEEDARAEGVAPVPFCRAGWPAGNEHRESFAELWDRINGKRAPWGTNPWVWAISFRRLTP